MENQTNNDVSTTVSVTKPKSKLPVIAGSALGTVAVAGIAAACVFHFVPSARDWIDRKTSSPDEYFAEKEDKYIDENVSTISDNLAKASDVYDSFDLSNLDLNNLKLPAGAYDMTTTVSFDVNAIVDWAGKIDSASIDTSSTEIQTALELMSTAKSFSIDGAVVSDGNGLLSLKGGLLLNDNSVIDVSLIMDTVNKSIYVAIPTISDSYLKYTLTEDQINSITEEIKSSTDSDEMSEYLEYMEMSAEVTDLLSQNLGDIVKDYYKVMVDGIKDKMSMDEDATIEVAGSEFTVTEMSGEITAEDAQGIAKDFLNQAKDDENLKSIAKALGGEDEYASAIEEALSSLDEEFSDDDNETLNVYAWTDKDGNIIGHKISDDDTEIGYACIENDDNTYASFWAKGDGSFEYSVVMNGKDKDNGTFKFKVDADGSCIIETIDYSDYKMVDEEKGKFDVDAKMTIDIDDDSITDDVKDIIDSMSINIASKCEDDSQTISYDICDGDNTLFGISLKGSASSDTTVNIPDSVFEITMEDPTTAIISYLETLNLTPLKENIEKSLDNSVITEGIETIYTQLGLDKIDGTQSADDVITLFQSISESFGASSSTDSYDDYSDYDYSDDDYSDYDYSDYDYSDDDYSDYDYSDYDYSDDSTDSDSSAMDTADLSSSF